MVGETQVSWSMIIVLPLLLCDSKIWTDVCIYLVVHAILHGMKAYISCNMVPFLPELSANRPPSTGSYAGGLTGIDKKAHQLDKEYSELMDQYRRLKQMRKTPERDAQVNHCLKVGLTFNLPVCYLPC